MLAIANSALDVTRASLIEVNGGEWALARTSAGPRLVGFSQAGPRAFMDFDGERSPKDGGALLVAPLTSRNAAALRHHVPWLAPRPLGLRTSAGLGDRLGLATPGHVRAVLRTGGRIAPIFAQQSVREMTRTQRSPQQVLDAATWGAFEAGWRGDQGADADHLKTTADIDACLAAGFTLFTIDPGEHVWGGADTANPRSVAEAVEALPWAVLEDSASAMRARYLGRAFDMEGTSIRFDEATLARAAAKYGPAIAHVTAMFRHLAASAPPDAFELEVSVDETDTPTSHVEHVFIASELRRLAVRWVSLAPRYVGRFEKGVDYLGDLAALDADLARHAAIARQLGPYKLSLHSGSDKFSVYPMAAARTKGLVHLKTAGTSYLEALRTIASLAPSLFRDMYVYSRQRYETDRASYHVSATLDGAPAPADLSDAALPDLLEQFDAREILHVTFGSVLTAQAGGAPLFADRLIAVLEAHPDAYAAHLEAHFVKHLQPFVAFAIGAP